MKLFKSQHSKNGSYSVWLTVSVIIITIVINLFVGMIPKDYTNLDMSDSRIYTVGEVTKEYLKTLDKDIVLHIIANPDTVDKRIVRLVEKYDELSDHITTETVDPSLHPGILDEYNTSDQNIVVSCAETDKFTKIDFADIIVYDPIAYYQSNQYIETEFDGEGLITGAIDFVTNGTTRKVYRTIDHSEAALSSAVKKLLEKSNFELADISLMKEKKIPADCNVLIMNGLQTDISVAEKKILNDYLDKGGDAVIILADTDKETPNLYALVKEYGLEVHDGLVGDNKNFYQDNPLNIFPTLSDNHAVTSTLNENSLVLAVGSKGMTETQTARESIHMSEFMTTSEDSYVIDGAEVTPGQYILGATSWEKIDDTNTARVTIISASNLINNNITAAYTNLSNLDIFMNSILWCYDENVKNLSIPAKNLRAVPNTVQAHMFWDLLFIFIIPVGLLIVGFVVFIKRRKA